MLPTDPTVSGIKEGVVISTTQSLNGIFFAKKISILIKIEIKVLKLIVSVIKLLNLPFDVP